MARITRITTQKKYKNRYNIFLDDGQGEKYGFSVDEAVLVEYRLRKNLELDESQISTLIQKDTLHKSYTLAITFLSYRMRTKKEIYDYLVKKEVDEEHIPQIIDKLTEEKLLDDVQFANMFVSSRINTSTKGPLLIKKELMDKGVSETIANEAIQQFTYEEQYDKASKWAEKKLSQSKKDSFRQRVDKLRANLMQKGFTQDVVKDVFFQIEEVKDDEAEWENAIYQGEKLLRKHGRKLEGYELRHKIKEGLYRKGFPMEIIEKFLDEHL
ncbi:recombination regulator RecX [Virgibacillus sp. YIM 98842]|uniref:recombination regulator RecX n=1 Tax=Virgibacillus sp. YIM 98842 TaxID=2663533 RepID=UPI0013DAFFA4|nr:recombination regulator RecX [Virgibacillus sp. YIM 98842]